MHRAAFYYKTGDYRKAFAWYQKAADMGSCDAMAHAAMMIVQAQKLGLDNVVINNHSYSTNDQKMKEIVPEWLLNACKKGSPVAHLYAAEIFLAENYLKANYLNQARDHVHIVMRHPRATTLMRTVAQQHLDMIGCLNMQKAWYDAGQVVSKK